MNGALRRKQIEGAVAGTLETQLTQPKLLQLTA